LTAGRYIRRRKWLLWLTGMSLAVCVWGGIAYRHSSSRGLPYRDSFAKGNADEWKAFGGTWELVNGSMRNDSDERGAKLLTGSSRWTDYSVEADVMLLGLGGDAGYAGLRTLDNSLVIGRAGHGWVEMSDKLELQQQGVRASQWYHLKLLAYGCQLAVRATLLPERGAGTTIGVTDRECIRSGRAGLRSYASGGVWRNVVIRPAAPADLTEMLAAAGREFGMEGRRANDEQSPWGLYASSPTTGSQALPSSPNAQLIRTLRLPTSSKSLTATVRGTVVLASPALFVQDATGGVAVQQG